MKNGVVVREPTDDFALEVGSAYVGSGPVQPVLKIDVTFLHVTFRHVTLTPPRKPWS